VVPSFIGLPRNPVFRDEAANPPADDHLNNPAHLAAGSLRRLKATKTSAAEIKLGREQNDKYSLDIE
jgi:hypothetical protein